jgi:hypothetical protein
MEDVTNHKLETARNIWIGTVRPDGRPHLVPIWYVWVSGKIYICIDHNSVKARNMMSNPNVVLALENGNNPVICEGKAKEIHKPFPDDVVNDFLKKYDWDIHQDTEYQMLVEVTPDKWLAW